MPYLHVSTAFNRAKSRTRPGSCAIGSPWFSHLCALLAPVISVTCSVSCGNESSAEQASDEISVRTDNSLVTLQLIVPSSEADPFDRLDYIRIDVIFDGTTLASQNFSYPADTPELNNLTDYGPIRFQVVGLRSGDVASLGRSAEVVVAAGQDLDVPVVFLPVNQVFPIDNQMTDWRSDHVAVSTTDGRVLLLGGHDPDRLASLEDAELFDPFTFEFSPIEVPVEDQSYLGVGMAPHLEPIDGDIIIVGGETLEEGQVAPVSGVSGFTPATESLQLKATLNLARREHCAALFMDTAVLVLGGEGTGGVGEILREDSEGKWSTEDFGITVEGFDSEAVSHCVAADDGRVFILGQGSASTGIWDYLGTGAGYGDAFESSPDGYSDATWVWNATVIQIDDGDFWIAGGMDLESKDHEVLSTGQRFNMDTMFFKPAWSLGEPRQLASWDTWIEDDWYVVGCGYSDSTMAESANSLEILDPLEERTGVVVELDRPRPGCRITTLLDGSILVTGGFGANATWGDASAALLVPYWGD